MKKASIGLIRFYQRYISLFFQGSCRYYPSCSEYAKWRFEHEHFVIAFWGTALRILRCNQFFSGGFDYPRVRLRLPSATSGIVKPVTYWYVPVENRRYLIVKSIFTPQRPDDVQEKTSKSR